VSIAVGIVLTTRSYNMCAKGRYISNWLA